MIKSLFSDPTRTLKIAAVLIAAGLLAEAITLQFVHPFAFMGFIFFGGGMISIGVLLYLLTLLTSPARSADTD